MRRVASRHKIPRARYKVANWPAYDKALQQRGSLTVWVAPNALAAWHLPHTGQHDRPRDYVDLAIKTGLKVYGAGEELVEKHGERGPRTWRKLHLAVVPSIGEILASVWTGNKDGDASQVGALLVQIPSPLASVTADGAYDGEPIYQAVAERQPDPPVAVVSHHAPPRCRAQSRAPHRPSATSTSR